MRKHTVAAAPAAHHGRDRHAVQAYDKDVFEAARNGDMSGIEAAIKDGLRRGYPAHVILSAREPLLHQSALHFAAESGHCDVVEFIIGKTLEVDIHDKSGVTPLHLAADRNHLDVARLLLRMRANPSVADVNGDGPIHWAATKGHSEMIELLLDAGVRVDTANQKGFTALHRTALNGRTELCRLLIRRDASVMAVTHEWDTPLHLACKACHVPVIELLLQLGARVDMLNKKGQAPMDVCPIDGLRKVVGEIGAGADSVEAARRKFAEDRAAAAADAAAADAADARTPSLQPAPSAGLPSALSGLSVGGAGGGGGHRPPEREESRLRFITNSLASFRKNPSTGLDGDGFPDESQNFESVLEAPRARHMSIADAMRQHELEQRESQRAVIRSRRASDCSSQSDSDNEAILDALAMRLHRSAKGGAPRAAVPLPAWAKRDDSGGFP